jgi:hypothetical protein
MYAVGKTNTTVSFDSAGNNVGEYLESADEPAARIMSGGSTGGADKADGTDEEGTHSPRRVESVRRRDMTGGGRSSVEAEEV